LRPESLFFSDSNKTLSKDYWPLNGKIARYEYLGNLAKYEITLSEDLKILVTDYNINPTQIRKTGEAVTLYYPLAQALIFQEDLLK